MKYLWAGLVVAGAAFIVLGVVWKTAVFPGLEKMPADFKRTDNIAGEYTVIDPVVYQVKANATLGQLMASPATVQMFKDPAVQQLLGNPTFAQLMANPAQLLGLLSSPGAIQQLPDPALKQALASPAVQKLLTDPAIQGLLKDPAALKLVLDPRVMPMLFDPTELPTVKVPVKITRVREATGVDGNKAFLNETITILRADNGQPLEGYPETKAKLVVDRHTSEYLPGTDGGRTGYLGLPFRPDPAVTYPMWSTVANATLDAKYVENATIDGLDVMVYRIEVTDRPLGDDPTFKLPKVMDSNLTVWVEPHSGRIVNVQDHVTSVSLVRPAGKLPVYVSDYKLADDSRALQVSEGKRDKSALTLAGVTVPWVLIAVGAVLGGVGALMTVMSFRKGASTTAEEPKAAAKP